MWQLDKDIHLELTHIAPDNNNSNERKTRNIYINKLFNYILQSFERYKKGVFLPESLFEKLYILKFWIQTLLNIYCIIFNMQLTLYFPFVLGSPVKSDCSYLTIFSTFEKKIKYLNQNNYKSIDNIKLYKPKDLHLA